MSPYLNLLRRDAAPVNNYYSLVRPQQRQLAFNEQQRAINLQQQSNLQAQQRGLVQVQEGLMEMRSPEVRATGTGGGFMNYAHYYNFPRAQASRR